MRVSRVLRRSLVLATACTTLSACSHPTGVRGRTETSLALTTAPDIAAVVTKAWYESGNGPAGPVAQWNVWLAVPPATEANAGVVVGRKAPVFLREGGRVFTAAGSDIRAGDRVEVWRDPVFVGYGAVQAPPGAPVYEGTQLVIDR